MRKINKLVIVIFIIVSSIILMPQSQVRATQSAGDVAASITPTNPGSANYSDLARVVGKIMAFLQIASGITTVIVIAFLGIKLIMTMPNDRIIAIKKMFPIVIGIVLVFGATSIARFLIAIV